MGNKTIEDKLSTKQQLIKDMDKLLKIKFRRNNKAWVFILDIFCNDFFF